MHHAYLLSIPDLDQESWSSWLAYYVGIFDVLRIELPGSQHSTLEFSKCLKLPPQQFLEILVDAWNLNHLHSKLSQKALPFLRGMPRAWGGKEIARLDQTFLPLPHLQKDAPHVVSFLDLPDPDDKKWLQLEHVGVVTKKDCRYWLGCLKAYSELTDNSVFTKEVTEIYQTLYRNFKLDSSFIK